MKLNQLTKIKTKSAKRVGRGPGSGKGKTGGKGQKGQNVRGKIPITHSHYEGGQRPLFKRLPYKRGKGNKIFSKKPLIVNLQALNKLPANSIVEVALLVEHRVVDKDDAESYGVKILGNGELARALTIALPISKSAAKKVEKAGGKVIISQQSKLKVAEQEKPQPSKTQSQIKTKNSKTAKKQKGK